MSRIARKLCNDVVDHPWKGSNDDLTLNKTTCKTVTHSNKPKRSITIEKKKVTNKVSNPVKDIRHNIKSKETVSKKKIIDASVNTLVSGPLRCDNDCVTVVRKRDNKENCKCSQRSRNNPLCSIQIQTLDDNIFHANKACSASVEMANCSTQVFDKSKCSDSTQIRSNFKMFNYNRPTSERRETMFINNIKKNHELTQNKYSNMINNNKPTYRNNFSGARRWALSQLPIQGPDF